jgi:hypothetical protein
MRALAIVGMVLWISVPIVAVLDTCRAFLNREFRTKAVSATMACLAVAVLLYVAIFPAGYFDNVGLLFEIGVTGLVVGIVGILIGLATEGQMRMRVIGSAAILMIWIPLTAFAALPSS